MEVKEIIERILKKRKISLYRLAKELDVSYTQAWRWRQGRSKPLPVFKKKLENILKNS